MAIHLLSKSFLLNFDFWRPEDLFRIEVNELVFLCWESRRLKGRSFNLFESSGVTMAETERGPEVSFLAYAIFW